MLEFWPKMFKSIKYFKHHIKVYKNVKIAKQDIDQTDLLLSQSLAQSVSQPTGPRSLVTNMASVKTDKCDDM